jgi:hypothetical protein
LASTILRVLFFQAWLEFVGLTSSERVFQLLQPGHLPIHFGLSNPQDLQKKADFVFAILQSSFILRGYPFVVDNLI